jgi:phosphoribosylaminoimidazole carboxylase PurE protein
VPRKPQVAVLMGSDSDLPVMIECVRVLEEYGIGHEVKVLSAHRTPEAAATFAQSAEREGLKVLVAGAGGAAHLAGALAAHSTLPVIGVPLGGSPLSGFDALLSTVQMPPGVPVATVGVGSMGARNAGHLAATLLALGDPALRRRLKQRRRAMARQVLAKDAQLPERVKKLLASR